MPLAESKTVPEPRPVDIHIHIVAGNHSLMNIQIMMHSDGTLDNPRVHVPETAMIHTLHNSRTMLNGPPGTLPPVAAIAMVIPIGGRLLSICKK